MAENPIRILIIDDEAEYVSVFKHYLRSFQHRTFQVTWAIDGQTALQQLANCEFDIILIDYYLPDTNGLEITKKVLDAKINIPIILLTANKDFHLAVEAIKFGVEEYLVKDEAVDTILPRAIINVVERVQLKKEIQEAENAQKRAEAIQELIVTMCHEFNNPLAAIKISTDILSRQKSSETNNNLLLSLNKNITLLEKQIIKLRDLNLEK
jgi:DNA-binding NtrC family response regulator